MSKAEPDISNSTFFDTDMFHHSRSYDPFVEVAALNEFDNCESSAISAFCLVELKRCYLHDLKLLRNKVNEAKNFRSVYSKIRHVGGRRSGRMLGMLMVLLDSESFSVNPWEPAQQELLTHLDTQLEITWAEFEDMVDIICDDFDCTRYKEIPEQKQNGQWVLTIHKCRRQNTTCKIAQFMIDHKEKLELLTRHLESLDEEACTGDLKKIRSCLQKFLKKGQF